MIEQDAHAEALDIAAKIGIADQGWFVDVLTAKLMTFYHRGAVAALDRCIAEIGPRGETNIVRTLQDGDRIVP